MTEEVNGGRIDRINELTNQLMPYYLTILFTGSSLTSRQMFFHNFIFKLT